MKLLALDTSSNACSVAVANGNRIVERHVVEPREHTKILLPMIEDALLCAKLALDGLDAIVLGNGPGSFIGMRIAASVAQGLAFGAGLKIVPVSSLAAIAAEVLSKDSTAWVAVAQDARMSEIYLGLYRQGPAGVPSLLAPEAIYPAARISWPDQSKQPWSAAGEGWHRYPKLLESNRDHITAVSEIRLPRARYLLESGAQGQPIDPHMLTPAYLRTKVAEAPR